MVPASPIDDYATGILLRHLKASSSMAPGNARIDLARDRQFLHCHWAISGPVQRLAHYLLENRHETQSLITFRSRVDDAVARGRIDGRATLLHRLKSGLPTAIVASEPVRSYSTGPNQILAWVLRHAWQMATRFHSWQEPGTSYESHTHSVVRTLGQVGRIESIRSMLGETRVPVRPLGPSVAAAEKSRLRLYRLAHDAYQLFISIERGDRDAISTMLQETLLTPLEDWRRLELAVALGIGEALSCVTQQPLRLELLGMDARKPIIRCSQFAVFWQTLTAHYSPPTLEPSEEKTADILRAYGLGSSMERPDLVVVDEAASAVVAIIEVKFHAGDNAASRFREAVAQIVRYGRGYAGDPSDLLTRSAVAMNVPVPPLVEAAAGIPAAFSFEDMLHGKLEPWIRVNWRP